MSTENLIGHGVCPVCANVKAKFTVTKKQLACMTCNACNVQIFARSDSSDEKLRACIRAATPAAPAPAPAAEIQPPQAAKTDDKPTPPPPPKKAAMAWGFLGANNG